MSGSVCRTCVTPESLPNPRNLAVFIDGTSNTPGEKETNVMKLYNQAKENSASLQGREPEQHRLYLRGIGASHKVKPTPLDRLSNLPDIFFARNMEENVKAAYSWLVDTYQGGDNIYLFGFSRGAYQVRSLASMIHEVGLVRDKLQGKVDMAYDHYRSIDFHNDETRKNAIRFKKEFSWKGVRIHFVGVWDTVSSLGVIKKDVHVTSSASVTNACHFRHALALDECRVKFMPEYFMEINAHHGSIQSPKTNVSDVREVWFAGSHSDVGGTNRSEIHGEQSTYPDDDDRISDPEDDDRISDPVHAGNVSLLWMRREAAVHGLVFKKEKVTWDPKDVDQGTTNSLSFGWKIAEICPFRHQLSFCGTGKHGMRWFGHLARPRSVIPRQQIHSSILFSDVYTPRAVLGDGVDIPIVPRRTSGGLWTAESQDEGATTQLLTSLLIDQRKTPEFLEKVVFQVLNSGTENRQAQAILTPQWYGYIDRQSGLDKLALNAISGVISGIENSDERLKDARDSLSTILSGPNQTYPSGAFYVLRFLAEHQMLRRHFFVHNEAITALMLALERTAKSTSDNSFQLVMDSLCYLINDDSNGMRDKVADQLGESLDGANNERTRLSLVLEVKGSTRLMASLRMITCLARHLPDTCKGLESKIIALAEERKCSVGPMAVEALVTLNASLTQAVPFANILGCLCNTLPRLDAEVGNTSSSDNAGDLGLPLVLKVSGSETLDEKIMRKLLSAVESCHARERTAATLTLLKLCKSSVIREWCLQKKVMNILTRQMGRKKTSLLATYALKMCIKQGVVQETSFDFQSAAKFIVAMLNNGWFDGAIGQVEGGEIFRELMKIDNLREKVISNHIVDILVTKLAAGERHGVRMSLICLDIFGRSILTELTSHVKGSIANLSAKSKKNQKKGVMTLSGLALTMVGGQAIEPHLIDIVRMLLPSSGLQESQLLGPAITLHNLSKNETLRNTIKTSEEYSTWKRSRRPHA